MCQAYERDKACTLCGRRVGESIFFFNSQITSLSCIHRASLLLYVYVAKYSSQVFFFPDHASLKRDLFPDQGWNAPCIEAQSSTNGLPWKSATKWILEKVSAGEFREERGFQSRMIREDFHSSVI